MKFIFETNDFTEKRYLEFLDFINASQRDCILDNNIIDKENSIILRHDVDVSPHRALWMAREEAKRGIFSNFYVLLTSPHYNVFELEIRKTLKEILSLGHSIGLHFDASGFSSETILSEVEDVFKFELNTLEKIIGTKINSFTFHNPGDINLLNPRMEFFCEIQNMFSERIFKQFKYHSDSNGMWKYGKLEDFLEQNRNKPIQVLFHAEWWTGEYAEPREKIVRALNGRLQGTINKYDAYFRGKK